MPAELLMPLLWIPASAGMTTKNGKKGKVSRVIDSVFELADCRNEKWVLVS
jgi:hypothetical protein